MICFFNAAAGLRCWDSCDICFRVYYPYGSLVAMMLGIVTTCLLLTVMISTYFITLLQSQRDTELQQTNL